MLMQCEVVQCKQSANYTLRKVTPDVRKSYLFQLAEVEVDLQ